MDTTLAPPATPTLLGDDPADPTPEGPWWLDGGVPEDRGTPRRAPGTAGASTSTGELGGSRGGGVRSCSRATTKGRGRGGWRRRGVGEGGWVGCGKQQCRPTVGVQRVEVKASSTPCPASRGRRSPTPTRVTAGGTPTPGPNPVGDTLPRTRWLEPASPGWGDVDPRRPWGTRYVGRVSMGGSGGDGVGAGPEAGACSLQTASLLVARSTGVDGTPGGSGAAGSLLVVGAGGRG
jgi:hypothetical protein